jgi:glycosyltransferase involved in cell wall biosynthesis
MSTTPLVILSDSPLGSTGLGRVARELSEHIHADLSDVFRLAVIGVGGTTTCRSPFPIYPVCLNPDYSIPHLPGIWRDFCGDEEGVLLTIMNAGWLHWLACPDQGEIGKFVRGARMRKWAYVPVDAYGPAGTMTNHEASILKGFDRLLAYTKFGADVINASLKNECAQFIPHGIDTSIFYPRDRKEARRRFLSGVTGGKGGIVSDRVLLLGIVATNSARKDWGLGLETAKELVVRGHDVGVWAHTDSLAGYWNLLQLADELGLSRKVIFTTGKVSNEALAWAYAACDVTLGIGAGEGWGLPLAESIACGTPVAHGSYAGGAEFLPKYYLVDASAWRIDGPYCARRPVFNPKDWADKVEQIKDDFPIVPEYIKWKNAWEQWKKWLLQGEK